MPFKLLEDDGQYFHLLAPERLRVLKLVHWEKMNYAEIERDTGWAPGTVRSRLHRARLAILRLRAADAAKAETWQAPTLGR